jgi:hypothetical protein
LQANQRECEAPAEHAARSITPESRKIITGTVMTTFGRSRRPIQSTRSPIIIFLCALRALRGSFFFVLSLEEEKE